MAGNLPPLFHPAVRKWAAHFHRSDLLADLSALLERANLRLVITNIVLWAQIQPSCRYVKNGRNISWKILLSVIPGDRSGFSLSDEFLFSFSGHSIDEERTEMLVRRENKFPALSSRRKNFCAPTTRLPNNRQTSVLYTLV